VTTTDRPGRIMVVDDDATLADVVGRYLVRDGHQVECCGDGFEALRRIADEPPDLVVLDLMLPGMDGLEICRRLRAQWPIPVSPRELALRVKSVLRRARGGGLPDAHSLGVVKDGDLMIDLGAHAATLKGNALALTSREYDLLAFLMQHPGQAFTREQLLGHVWSWTFGDTSTVTVHIRRLREKIESDPTMPRRLVTVWGVGYRYEPEHA
jgi:DNA-binding response OmpR family regulator